MNEVTEVESKTSKERENQFSINQGLSWEYSKNKIVTVQQIHLKVVW